MNEGDQRAVADLLSMIRTLNVIAKLLQSLVDDIQERSEEKSNGGENG